MTPRLRLIVLSLIALIVSAPMARAETIAFATDLKEPAETSSASGKLDATFETTTNMLSWIIVYSGLTGGPTGAYFHGPAESDTFFTATIHLSGSFASPIKGSSHLTKMQAADLLAGKWYFVIHTAANPRGELRGQLARAQTP